jgi:oxygen-independent coproporphyrinogen-3 oxidase
MAVNTQIHNGGIYIHIPFCKQACHYCDFHFSTSLKYKDRMVAAICAEIILRKAEISAPIKTIYFGGGTPSLLTSEEIKTIITTVYSTFDVLPNPEITLEANPDDLSEVVVKALAKSPINRLSIGIQSFFEDDLNLMNRAHNANEAETSINFAKKYFTNISIDLIYGIPGMTKERWIANVDKAFAFEIPHFSCYALTVEPKTALDTFIKKGIIPPVEDELAQEHHAALIEKMEAAGYDNYEFSNFSRPGWESQNNMAYWQGKPYLGVGPSAHSYDGDSRSWNVSNNSKYLKSIEKGELPIERESLSIKDKYNEYVMTRLRTKWGISLEEIKIKFGERYLEYLLEQAAQFITSKHLKLTNNTLLVTKKGKFLSDGIASGLFLVNW